uniref:F-box domain-containing protein n=1 Tax=Brassica oleracea TaxID=3712 RepID=A0A3P6EHQ8_BRAOL|nr:unnamed protein product [Brassica oleracea]
MTNFLMLPDDLVLNCLARVSRLDYPILSLVSKRLIPIAPCLNKASPLYVCLSLSTDPNPTLWFTLCRPTPNSSKKILIPVWCKKKEKKFNPGFISNLPPCSSSSQVSVVDPNIYFSGGKKKKTFFFSQKIFFKKLLQKKSQILTKHYRIFFKRYTKKNSPNFKGSLDPTSLLVPPTLSMNVARAFHSANLLASVMRKYMFLIPRHKLGIFLQIPSEEICRASGYKSVTLKERSM